MKIVWNDKETIYRQLHDRLVELILEGVFPEGEALPSIREISSEHRINHITVAKAFQMLVDEGLVEKRRGVGMYVRAGVSEKLMKLEKDKFLTEELPVICDRVKRLGLEEKDLIDAIRKSINKAGKDS